MASCGVPVGDSELAAMLAAVAQALAVERGPSMVVQRACSLARATIGACDHADVMVAAPHGTLTVPSATDWVGIRLVSFEEEYGEGPCTEALRTGTMVNVLDHTTETRWPQFTHRCVTETPVRSGVGLPLLIGDRAIGALDLYANRPHAFNEGDRAMAALFASHAAVALAAAQDRVNLERALASRDIIGQAKGILMAESHVTGDEAFDMLIRASQRLNKKLNTVAEDIVNKHDAL